MPSVTLSTFLSTFVSIYLHIHLSFHLSFHLSICFPGGSVVKNPPADAGDARDVGSIPGSGRSPGGEDGHPLQRSCLGNSVDRGACYGRDRGVAKSRTWLSTAQNTCISVSTCPPPYPPIKWLSICESIHYDPSTYLSTIFQPIYILPIFISTSWRRQWHPTPVLLPGKSHGPRSLAGCSPWGR